MAREAVESGKYNVAFEAYYLLAEPDNCVDVLVKAKRIAEAAIFAKAHAPSRIPELIPLWSKSLKDQELLFQPDDITKSQADLI